MPHAVKHLTHWDEVERRRLDVGPLRATWSDLGRAAGSVGCSVKHEIVDPGARPTPAHSHGSDEEFFFVLSGSGLSWQDGVTHPIAAGDCLLHRPAEAAHTVIAGDRGIELLVFGPEASTSLTRLPRAGVFWAGPWWIADDAGPARPFEREPVAIDGTPGQRPDTTVHLDDCPAYEWGRGACRATRRDLGRRLGSTTTGLGHWQVPPHACSAPLHCHSAEHEIFVVLDGDGTLTLGDDTHPVRRGHVVARPPGTGVAHQFQAGPDGLAFLAWSTRDPGDLCFYPRSSKISFRGLKVIARVQPVDYWDGEQ